MKLNPFAVKAMAAVGIDISSHVSNSIEDFCVEDFDLIITLCAEEVCPLVQGSTDKRHWPFPDPAAKEGRDEDILASFEEVRDCIRQKLVQLGVEFELLGSTSRTPTP
jgi:arsenate reductase